MRMTVEELQRARANDVRLSAYRDAQRDARHLRRVLRELEDRARDVATLNIDGVRVRSSGSDAVGDLAAALAETTEHYRVRLAESLQAMERVERWIAEAALPAASDRHLLELRYIGSLSYGRLAEAAGYADATTARRRVWRLLSLMELE